MNRNEALELVRKYTKNENLVKHMLAVEAAMNLYYKKFESSSPDLLRSTTVSNLGSQADEFTSSKQSGDEWAICGLLHDFDYEKMGPDHPSEWGYEILRQKGVDDDLIQAIKGHADRDNPDSRPTKMAKTLFAVDELTGFVVACALVNPEKLSGLKVDSIKKKFKKKDFAKAVSREDMFQGARELGVDMDEHIQIVLDAMIGIKDELGL